MRFQAKLLGDMRATFLLAALLTGGLFAFAGGLRALAPLSTEARRAEDTRWLLAVGRKYFPGPEVAAPKKRIFRLTREQLDATVRALLPGYRLPSIKASMARDPLQTNYEFAELLSFNSANTAPLAGWIGSIAAEVKKNPAGVVSCPGASPTAECLSAAARRFVIRAFRGDVGDGAQVRRIVDFFVTSVPEVGVAQATADLVEVTLSSPSFLFRREIEIRPGGQLIEPQALQGLTYLLTDQPPEALDLPSERARDLLPSSTETIGVVDRLLRTRQAREKLVRFFAAWLEIKEPGELTISEKVFPEFNAKLAESMRQEALTFLRERLLREAPTLRDITQATKGFASLRAAGVGGERFGVFTLPGVLAAHSGPTGTRPMKRGTFFVRKIMCIEMEPPPPPGLDLTVPDIPNATEREKLEAVNNQAACIGCHKYIDPFGFMLENYDALGRWRTTDNGKQIDAGIEMRFLDEGPIEADGPVDALRAITNSVMFKQCFVRQLFRFYMGRQEEASDDPMLRRLFYEFARNDNQDLLKLVRLFATADRFLGRH